MPQNGSLTTQEPEEVLNASHKRMYGPVGRYIEVVRTETIRHPELFLDPYTCVAQHGIPFNYATLVLDFFFFFDSKRVFSPEDLRG